MPTIRVEIPSRNQIIEFDEGTSESVIQDVIKRDFPRNGNDVAYEVAQLPGFSKAISDEDFVLYEDYLDKKKTDYVSAFAGGVSGIADTVGKGVAGIFQLRNLDPRVAASTAIEGAAQGTRDLYGMVAQSTDPTSYMFRFTNWLNGTGTVQDRKSQWIEANEFTERSARIAQGEEAIVPGINPAFVNADVRNAIGLVADPSVLIPGLNVSAVGAKAVGAGLRASGRVAQAVTRPLVNVIDRVGEVASEALGTKLDSVRNVAAGTGISGLALGVPGVSQAAAVIGGVEAVSKLGRVAEQAGEQLAQAPTRIGPLESIGRAPNATSIDRALGRVGRFGGDDLIDIGTRSLAGAVEGAVIGGGLGFLSQGEEGFAAGIGSGGALGAGAAGVVRGVQKASGVAARQARANDYEIFRDGLNEADQSKFDTIVKNSGINGAVQVMDTAGIIRGKFNDAEIRFLTSEEFTKEHGVDARGVKVVNVEAQRPVVEINVDKIGSERTAFHELFHVFKAIDNLRPAAEKVEQTIVGNWIIDKNGKSVQTSPGFMDEAQILSRFDEYVSKLAENDPNRKINTVAEKAAFVGEELASEYMSKMIAGSSTDSMLRGFDDFTRTVVDRALLSNNDGFLRRTAQSLGLGSKPIESLLFNNLQEASPALNAQLRDMVRMRRNMDKKLELADEVQVTNIQKKDLSNPVAAQLAVEMNIAEKGADGVTRMKLDDVMSQEDKVSLDSLKSVIKSTPVADVNEPRMRELDGKISGVGISNAQLAAIQASPNILDKVKQSFALIKSAIDNGEVLYIRNGKATKKITSRLTGKTLTRYNDGVRMTERDGVPYSLAENKAGELYLNLFDISKARRNAMDLASKDRLGPYQADFQAFYGDLVRYLNNLSDPVNRVPSKELLGDAAKAAYLTDFFGQKEGDGKASKFIRSLTLDRMVEMRPTGERVRMTESAYDLNKARFMPAENLGETKVFDAPDSGFRIIAKGNKHSLYAPTGERLGIYDTQAVAERKANISATKLQSEIRQQQSDSESFTISRSDMGRFMPASDKVNLEDYADRKIIALAADRMGIGQMSVGPKGEKRDLSLLGQGGRGFMNIFNGGGWAFSDQKTADRFISRLKKDADRNGNATVGITIQSPINHLKNQTGQLAYIEAMQAAIDSKTITRSAADAQIAAMSSAIVSSEAKSVKASAREKFSQINTLKELKKVVKGRGLNFADMDPLLTQMQRKKLPITERELSEMGMTAADIARDLADPELTDLPFGSVVALLGVNVNQAPSKTDFHYSYPWTVHGEAIGFLDKFYNIADLSTEKRIRNTSGAVTAQPLQTVMPIMDNIVNTIKTKQGIPSVPSARFMPSDAPESKFYGSRIISAVENSSQGKASGSQWKATIKNNKLGVNQDEYALVGVGDLEDGKTYTKAEVLDYLRANEVVVKDVTLGGRDSIDRDVDRVARQLATEDVGSESSYRDKIDPSGYDDYKSMSQQERFDAAWGMFSDEYIKTAREQIESTQTPEGETYFSQYTLPGAKEGSYREVLLTVPFKESSIKFPSYQDWLKNEIADGYQTSQYEVQNKRIYESDRKRANDIASEQLNWRDGHSQYSDIPNPIVRLRHNERTTSDGKRMLFIEEIQAPQKGQFEKMPALFQKNWREIAFKWALRTAADNGFDSVGYTTGKQQADRYDLSKEVRHIDYMPLPSGEKFVGVTLSRGSGGFSMNVKDGIVVASRQGAEQFEGKPLDQVVGKELAKRIAEGTNGRIEGEGLNVGGEGLKKLYDQDFRNVVNNLPVVKKSGQKVGMVELPGIGRNPLNNKPGGIQEITTGAVHSINVAPEMRNASVNFMPDDADYLAAVKSGDMKVVQGMVDEAAKAAGYTTKVFHGTISQFNKPNTPLFLGDEGTAMSYAKDRAMGYGEGANPVTYKIYAKFKNTASESDVKKAATDLGLEVENDMAFTALDPKISGSKYVSQVISELKKRSYDSANIDDFLPDNPHKVIKSFVAFDPSQLKLADPITKDNAGNVIPLSQRFNTKSEDIRFMPSVEFSAPEKLPNGQAWSTNMNYRVIQKTGGKYRVYAPIGTLIGVTESLEQAKRLIEKRNK